MYSPNLFIRKATPNDTVAIVAVIAPFVEDVIAHQQGRKQFTPEVIQTIFEREDIHYFVAELEQEVVGGRVFGTRTFNAFFPD